MFLRCLGIISAVNWCYVNKLILTECRKQEGRTHSSRRGIYWKIIHARSDGHSYSSICSRCIPVSIFATLLHSSNCRCAAMNLDTNVSHFFTLLGASSDSRKFCHLLAGRSTSCFETKQPSTFVLSDVKNKFGTGGTKADEREAV